MEKNTNYLIKQRNQAVLLDDKKELLKNCLLVSSLGEEDCLNEYYMQYAQKKTTFSFSAKPNQAQAKEIFFHQLNNNQPNFNWLEELVRTYLSDEQETYFSILLQTKETLDKEQANKLAKELFQMILVADEAKKDNRITHGILFIATGFLLYSLLALSVYFVIDLEALFFTNVFFLIVPTILIGKGILKLTIKRDPFYLVVIVAVFLLIIFSYITMFKLEPNILLHMKRIALFLIEFWEYIARKLV